MRHKSFPCAYSLGASNSRRNGSWSLRTPQALPQCSCRVTPECLPKPWQQLHGVSYAVDLDLQGPSQFLISSSCSPTIPWKETIPMVLKQNIVLVNGYLLQSINCPKMTRWIIIERYKIGELQNTRKLTSLLDPKILPLWIISETSNYEWLWVFIYKLCWQHHHKLQTIRELGYIVDNLY